MTILCKKMNYIIPAMLFDIMNNIGLIFLKKRLFRINFLFKIISVRCIILVNIGAGII